MTLTWQGLEGVLPLHDFGQALDTVCIVKHLLKLTEAASLMDVGRWAVARPLLVMCPCTMHLHLNMLSADKLSL
jgi:hypothetical protein